MLTYRELMANVSNKTNQSGHALGKILDSWINKMFEKAAYEMMANPGACTNMELFTEKLMIEQCSKLQELTCGFEFAQALRLFWKASRTTDEDEKFAQKEAVLRWFRGDYRTNQEAKKATGINAIVTDENWFDYIILWAQFFVIAGYKGFIVLIDEMVNIYKATSGVTRQMNYEKMLMMYNATLQGKAEYFGIIMGGIPMSIYDKKRGVFSYSAITSLQADVTVAGRVTMPTLQKITAAITNDNPHLYYFNQIEMELRGSLVQTQIILRYYYSRSEIIELSRCACLPLNPCHLL